jgi:hypothetical protein
VLARGPEVAASTGSACHDGHESASPVILAMGVAPDEARSSVRLTLGREAALYKANEDGGGALAARAMPDCAYLHAERKKPRRSPQSRPLMIG